MVLSQDPIQSNGHNPTWLARPYVLVVYGPRAIASQTRPIRELIKRISSYEDQGPVVTIYTV